uniref:Uncharacterized protein n=1 Tax=Zea mays TaxID=4577 RepID=C0PJU0_MAIZE|nr:unknown [Zea mays]
MQVKLNRQRHVQRHGERFPRQLNQPPRSHVHSIVTLFVEEHAADVEQLAASNDPPKNGGGVFFSSFGHRRASKFDGDPALDAVAQDGIDHFSGAIARLDSLDYGPVVVGEVVADAVAEYPPDVLVVLGGFSGLRAAIMEVEEESNWTVCRGGQ